MEQGEQGTGLSKKQIISLGVVILLLAAIPLTYFLVQKTQIFKSKASENGFGKGYTQALAAGELQAAQPIVELKFFYTESPALNITLTNSVRKQGYPIRNLTDGEKYQLEVLDQAGTTLYHLDFSIPNTKQVTLGKSEQLVKLKQTFFILTIPSLASAGEVRIIGPTGQKITQVAIVQQSVQENAPLVQPFFCQSSLFRKQHRLSEGQAWI